MPARPSLPTYQRSVAAFLAELGEAQFEALSGRRSDLVVAPIYERHAALFADEAIEWLRSAADGDSDDASQARALLAFAVEGRLEREVAALTEAVQNAEANAVVVWRGERLGYRSAPIRVAELSDRRERNGLNTSYLEAVEAINPLRAARFEGMRAVARALGYPDRIEMARRLRSVNVGLLSADLRQFLVESETVYYAAVRRYLAEIDIEQGDASSADVAHLLRGSGWDAWFPSGQMLPVVRRTLAGMGIDLEAMPNLSLDIEPRPGKAPRPFAVPVRVPDDIRMVLQPRGGHDDFGAMLHELGHLLHFASMRARLPVTWRYLGDDSVTEGYAFLFEHLLFEPDWLAERLGMGDAEIRGWLDFAAFRKLYMLRRYVAKLLYEQRLEADGPVASSRAYYAGLLGLLTGVQAPEEPFLADIDDHLYAARYLRAWMLEASLAASLRANHGPRWWTTTDAGAWLRSEWAHGQAMDAEDVVARLGYDRLDWRPVLRQIRTQLIGEMSGYGGPNITTRAGTRKV